MARYLLQPYFSFFYRFACFSCSFLLLIDLVKYIVSYILISDRINTVNTANTVMISYPICGYSSVVHRLGFLAKHVVIFV